MKLIFDHFTLDTDIAELRRGTATVALEPQVFDLLVFLIENREQVASKGWALHLRRRPINLCKIPQKSTAG